jgi:hypothetical protein
MYMLLQGCVLLLAIFLATDCSASQPRRLFGLLAAGPATDATGATLSSVAMAPQYSQLPSTPPDMPPSTPSFLFPNIAPTGGYGQRRLAGYGQVYSPANQGGAAVNDAAAMAILNHSGA